MYGRGLLRLRREPLAYQYGVLVVDILQVMEPIGETLQAQSKFISVRDLGCDQRLCVRFCYALRCLDFPSQPHDELAFQRVIVAQGK